MPVNLKDVQNKKYYLSRSKTLKTRQVENFTHSREMCEFFCHYQPERHVFSRIKFAYLGSVGKIFVPV